MINKGNELFRRQFGVLFLFLLIPLHGLFAQSWVKEETKNRWGDITGYSYHQTTRGTARSESSSIVQVFIVYGYVPNDSLNKNSLIIVSKTTGELDFHPASGFLNEKVTLSLRSNGITTSYSGTTIAEKSNFNMVAVLITSAELISKLKGSGQWDVLIEGRRWYINGSINGNLPRE